MAERNRSEQDGNSANTEELHLQIKLAEANARAAEAKLKLAQLEGGKRNVAQANGTESVVNGPSPQRAKTALPLAVRIPCLELFHGRPTFLFSLERASTLDYGRKCNRLCRRAAGCDSYPLPRYRR